MADYLASYTFNALQDGGAGWSENFYITGPTELSGALTRATNAALIAGRRALLHPYYRMYAIRVSDIAVRGDSLVRPLTIGEGIGLYPAPTVSADLGTVDTSEEPYDAVLMRMQTASGARRRMFKMAGIPTEIVQGNRQYLGDRVAAWDTRFNLWRNLLTGGLQACLRRREYSVPPVSVTNFVIQPDKLTMVFTLAIALPGPMNDQYVHIRGVTTPTNINGLYKVRSATTAAPFTLTCYPARSQRYGDVSGVMEARKVTYVLDGISTVLPVRGASKKAGRPFGSLVGRRRGRK